MVLAITGASLGVMLWQHFNPPPVVVETRAPTLAPAPLPAATLVVGDPRPELSLPDVDGKRRSIAEWDGKLLFVNFWATWCPPCLEEIPMFVRIHERYRARGVEFLGIALDSAENVRAFMLSHGVSYQSLHGEQDAIDAARAFGNAYGSLPYTAVIGRDGRIVHLQVGVLQESDVQQLIDANS